MYQEILDGYVFLNVEEKTRLDISNLFSWISFADITFRFTGSGIVSDTIVKIGDFKLKF